MAFKPGRAKTGGRKPGTPNKVSAAVAEQLAELGCNPIEILAGIAIDRKAPRALKVKAASELAKYVHPQKKAIEHSGGLTLSRPDDLFDSMSKEELEALDRAAKVVEAAERRREAKSNGETAQER